MSYLRSSNNYVWNTSKVLGKGATGAVYSGLHKSTGETVAVKSFNHLSQMRPYEVQIREFNVLKKVNHENIVKLLAIEEENETHQKVLIMELCTGGSLFSILDDPQNAYGLEEKEFLLVLKHLAAGMKHLRDNKIVHRDLKPGNIMKFISEDGQSIYKLTDFGAARELEEDQQFMSLYGTEEYLHPHMYERAVLRKSVGKTYGGYVDLWSIGVTMFHIATGSLPFRPYGGRKNKETMHRITTQKESGIISGTQHSENGEIEWSRTLPKSCLLSPAVQELVVPLLAGLLESDHRKIWSFEQFFSCVLDILTHKVYYIYYVNNTCDYTIYLPAADDLAQLKHRIERVAHVPIKSQLLMFNKLVLSDLTSFNIISDLENPLILINSDTTKMKVSSAGMIPVSGPGAVKFPDMSNTPSNCDTDAHQAKSSTATAYSIQKQIAKCANYYQIASSVPVSIIAMLESNVKLLNEKHLACNHIMASLESQLVFLHDTTSNLSQLSGKIATSNLGTLTDVKRLNEELQSAFSKCKVEWSNLFPKVAFMGEKIRGRREPWANGVQTMSPARPGAAYYGRIDIFSSAAKSKTFAVKIRESWQMLQKDKSARSLSYNEEQLHQLEKTKIDMNTKRMTSLLYQEAYKGIGELVEKLEDWYTGAQVSLVQSQCLFHELDIFMRNCEELQSQLNHLKDAQRQLWEQIFVICSEREADGSISLNPVNTAQQPMNAPITAHVTYPAATNGSPERSAGNTSVHANIIVNNQSRDGFSNWQMTSNNSAMGGHGGIGSSGSSPNTSPYATPTGERTNSNSNSGTNQSAINFFRPSIASFLDSFRTKLPPKLTQELEGVRDAQNKLLNALQENENLISEFESLAVRHEPPQA